MQSIMECREHLTSNKNPFFIGSVYRDFEYHCFHGYILYKMSKKANCIFTYFFYTSHMNTIQINSANIRIIENCYLYDTWDVEHVDVDIVGDVLVQYCFIGINQANPGRISRHIKIGKNTTFVGTGVLMDTINLEVITEVCGDDVKSNLDILALITNASNISAEWVARVDLPYRHVYTRVDQTNILIGTGGKIRWIPKLEIATDDIEGGHSCRIHRLGGEAVFYLTSRGLTSEHAEAMLLNSEIIRHLRTIEETNREKVCYDIHMKLKK